MRKSLSLDDRRVLAVIEAAGEEFYLRIARGVGHAQVNRLLAPNAWDRTLTQPVDWDALLAQLAARAAACTPTRPTSTARATAA